MKDRNDLFLYENIGESIEIPMIKEELTPYLARKQQGEFTVDDCDALPEEQQVELIDGVIYDMAAPTALHQVIRDEIRDVFRHFVDGKKGKCVVVTSPIDVRLDCNDKTMVQPDVLIVCDRDRFKLGRIYGAPDLIVEVLSPSTRKKDITIKKIKYMKAGVREYWIVDPEKKRIYVHRFVKDINPVIYTFDDRVPVKIFDGECEVDFQRIDDYVKFLYE